MLVLRWGKVEHNQIAIMVFAPKTYLEDRALENRKLRDSTNIDLSPGGKGTRDPGVHGEKKSINTHNPNHLFLEGGKKNRWL